MSKIPPLTPSSCITNLKTIEIPLGNILTESQKGLYDNFNRVRLDQEKKEATQTNENISLDKNENGESVIIQSGTSNLFNLVIINMPSLIITTTYLPSSSDGTKDKERKVEILPCALIGNNSINSTFIANLLNSEDCQKELFSIKLSPTGQSIDQSFLSSIHGGFENDWRVREVITEGCKEIIFKRMEYTHFKEVPGSVVDREGERLVGDGQGSESVKIGKMLIGYRFIKKIVISEE